MRELENKWMKGIVRTIAGTGIAGYSGDGSMAALAQLNGPTGLTIDQSNNLFFSEMHNHCIRKIDAITGVISTFAGCGSKGFDGDEGFAVNAKFNSPLGVCIDKNGNIIVADSLNHRIRKIHKETGIITTIAGTGHAGYNGDNIDATNADLNFPAGVVVDSTGNVYFNDFKNERIRMINDAGKIQTYAGTGASGYSGDLGLSNNAQINGVYGLAFDNFDNLYIMDSCNYAVRRVDAKSRIISTIAGKGKAGPLEEFVSISNAFIGGNELDDSINSDVPHALDVDSNGNIFIGETGCNKIRMIDFEQDRVFTIAGSGEKGNSGDNELSVKAKIQVNGLRVSSNGDIYFVDYNNHVIRAIKY
jgi:trimeric autotransporter adhesin